ncbi:MAG: FAD-dependent oxidoreductase [Syntrophothermus sp.]|uniref:FAD-dependent oxidoreductase n=1 Tax=Syntrophothermus sp. TaxID=2736299 RepID=UPI00257FE36F|nr:FAD-dependent oxidoreductase [Syntrophothermus sp.]NSW83408.1 FAD-dependent oxidoreductase [Syntrophothermus sp.]
MTGLKYLFRSGFIGSLAVSNRVFLPAMISGLAGVTGEVSPEMLAYYDARASSQPGVVVVEIACVDAPTGKAALNQLRIDHPRFLPGLRRLAERIKSWGPCAFIQLHHAGRQTTLLATEGQTPLSPSAVPDRSSRYICREMSLEDIELIREKFIKAAGLAVQAGFDGVEIHAGHGYLLGQFLSPHTNRRQDRYGRDATGRARLVMEIVDGIKAACPGLVVGVRFNVADFVPGGVEPDEGVYLAQILESAGSDYLSVTGGTHESGLTTVEPASFPEGWRMRLAAKVKKAVSVPVVGGGVIRHPEYAEQVLREGWVDYVFIGRGQLADGEWLAKARLQQSDRIRPCLSCNTCIAQSFYHLPVTCTVNPYIGRETWLNRPTQTSCPRRVVVAGGGPAGMTAAALLAAKGHRVTLIEAKQELGGMLTPASRVPHKRRLAEFRDYLVGELKRRGIDIRLGQRVTPKLLNQLQPEIAVVATGSVPRPCPGLAPGENVVQAAEVLASGEPVRNRRVAVVGGGAIGCETALYLATHENRVVVLEAGERLAQGLNPMSRRDLLDGLDAAGVEKVTGCVVVEVKGDIVRARDSCGRIFDIEAELVVLAVGLKPYNPLSSMLRTSVPEVFVIGDAVKPRNIAAAIFEAETLARRL